MEWRIVVLVASCSQLMACQSQNENAASTGSTTDVTAAPSDDTSSSSAADTTEGTTGAPSRAWCLVTHTIDAADGTLDDVDVAPQLADVDGDELPELWRVVKTKATSELTQYHVEPNGLAMTGDSHVLTGELQLFADINGDGHDDALLSDDSSGLWAWIDISTGTPGAPQVIDEPGHTRSWIDVDGDGDADAFASGWPDGWVELWINDGSGSLTLVSQLAADLDELNVINEVLPIDDGVFAVGSTDEAIDNGVYGASELRFEGGTLHIGAQTPVIEQRLERAADFDLDGRADFVTALAGVTVWHGSAAGASPIVLSEGHSLFEVGDFMGLGAPAVLLADNSGIQVHTDPLDPTQAPVAVVGEIVQLLHVVDFDGDGKDQLIDAWKDDDDAIRYRLADVRPCE